ncbi:MAG: tripartite tricarboxylate transporter substrate-binding protein, partial [Proteobacteria bacterium]|nr:tripartite tricarboxylate transporter substrate-binding protein [Pseudomonadota bacterium]
MRFILRAALAAQSLVMVAGSFAGGVARAAEFPLKPIRIIVPFAAGGPVDVLGRAAAAQMSASFGQNVLLDNRPGASGIVGM